MQTNSINSSNSHYVQQPEDVIPLQQRTAAAEDGPSITPVSETTIHLATFLEMIDRTSRTNPTIRGIIDLLMNIRNPDGSASLNSPGKMSSLLTQAVAELKKDGNMTPALEEAMTKAGAQLFFMNYSVEQLKQKVFFPTEENGGAIREY